MQLIDRIKADRLAAMKARDRTRANLLGTLASQAAKEAKQPDDATVIRTVRAFLKGVDETIAALEQAGRSHEQQDAKKAILEAYLPAMLDEAATRAAVDAAIAETGATYAKAMGKVMGALKAGHGAAIDMALASRLARERLQG